MLDELATMTAPYWLDPADDLFPFPDVSLALTEPDGLLAVGGNLSPARLENAYRHGIFPWYSEGQPILWWSPDPRSVLFPEKLRISRSLRKNIQKNRYRITFDQAFKEVITACAEQPRPGQGGTWILSEMADAYIQLHKQGIAHSVEAWLGIRWWVACMELRLEKYSLVNPCLHVPQMLRRLHLQRWLHIYDPGNSN